MQIARGGKLLRRPDRGVVLADPPEPPLTAPTRNRYFYGKLLDAYHLELEQRYFLERQRRLTRLTVGFGVVCGLDVTVGADEQTLVIEPGVAIDGLGREIVVTEQVHVDPTQLTDACGLPAGKATKDEVTVCLAYHECQTDPTPVLVSDCDVREQCAAGAIRERYAVLVEEGPPEAPPYGDIVSVCRLVGERLKELEGRKTGKPVTATHSVVERTRMASFVRPSYTGRTSGSLPGLRTFGAPTFDCAPPQETCVVLATVRLGARDGAPVVDPLTYRRTVLSNDRLLEAVLCLAAAVEECCAPKTKETISVTKGNRQNGTTGAYLPQPVVVRVTEGRKAQAGVEVTFEDDADGTFDPPTATTAANGTAEAKWRLGSTEGKQTARATTRSGASVSITATAKRG